MSDVPDSRARWAAVATAALLLPPWLSPLAGGPSASVHPWLVSAGCMVALLLCGPARIRPGLLLALALPVLFAWPQSSSSLDASALAGALALIAMAAAVGAASDARRVDAVASAWAVAALASTVIGLVQYFGAAEWFAPWVSQSEAGQAYANLRQRNQFASLTAIGVAALLWQARAGRSVRWLALAAFVLGVGDAASISRTGLAELALLTVLALAWPGRSRAQAVVVVAAAAGYALAAAGLPSLLQAVTGVESATLWQRVAGTAECSSRSVLWSNVLHLIGQRPWTGWGWGELDYAHYATLYPGARFCDILDNAHNLPLHLAVELGVPFALLACGTLTWALLRARPWAEADSTRQLAWSVLALLALHSLLEYPLWYGPFQIAAGLAAGLLMPVPVPERLARWAEPSRLAVGAVCAGMVLYAAWDYRRVSQVYLAPQARLPGYREDPLPLIRASWLFRSHAEFAELTLTPLTPDNAAWTNAAASRLLHYSPEPRMIQKIVDSAVILHREDELAFHLPRWKAAFPDAYAEWKAGRAE